MPQEKNVNNQMLDRERHLNQPAFNYTSGHAQPKQTKAKAQNPNTNANKQ